MKFSVILACLVIAVSVAKKRYDGYQVLEVVPESKTQLAYLRNIMFEQIEWDFWLEPTRLNKPVHVFLSPDDITIFREQMAPLGLLVKVIRENVQIELDAWEAKRANKPEQLDYDWDDYNTYDDYMTELENLVNECSTGKECTLETIGQSYEGRDINAMRITDSPIDESKPYFWMDSCIHAREWLACATLMRVVRHMLQDTGDDARRVLNSYNWYIVPIMNPDGYSYTHTDERFWRKSRNDDNDGSSCIGTDLNRNYNYKWGTPGASSNPCSDTYRGNEAASEPETQAVQDKAISLGDGNIRGWLTFHTNGQWWLEPYGDRTPPDEDGWPEDVRRVTTATCTAIANTYNTNWDCGNSAEVLYETSGTTADWAMGDRRAKYSYTPELRGPGFDPPPSAIPLSFTEIWNGMVAKIDEIAAIEGTSS